MENTLDLRGSSTFIHPVLSGVLKFFFPSLLYEKHFEGK